MIDYVEIRNESLELIGLIDTAKSIIWETQYFGAGAFEIYVEATPQAIALLQCGNFVTRVESEGVGIIEAAEIVFNAQDGRMITASGRLAKSILDRRLITYVNDNSNAATIFYGKVELRARGLVQDNAIACYKDKARTIPYPARNIDILQLGELAGLLETTEERQVSSENLLTYTDAFLQQYGYGAKLIRSGNKLNYTVYSGKDRSIGNAAGNQPVIFSEDFDNLVGSNYSLDETASKSFALVGGEEETETDPRLYVELNADVSGLERREVFIDAQSIKREIHRDEFVGDGGTKIEGTDRFNLPHIAKSILSVKVNGKSEHNWRLEDERTTVVLDHVPLKGEKIVIRYFDKSGSSYEEMLKGTGSKKTFSLKYPATSVTDVTITNFTVLYTLGTNKNAIAFDSAPAYGATVGVTYVAENGTTHYEELAGTGTKKTYNLKNPVSSIISVELKNRAPSSHEFDAAAGVIKFEPAPAEKAVITVAYVGKDGTTYADKFEGTGTKKTFALLNPAASVANVIVNVIVPSCESAANNRVVVFDPAPAEGAAVKITYVAVDGSTHFEEFVGTGTNKNFTLKYAARSLTSVTVDNVAPSYELDVDEGVINFDVAPASGTFIKVVYFDSNTIYTETFTGDGVEVPDPESGTRAFALTGTASKITAVSVDGKEAVWTFNASTGVITFAAPPLEGLEIVVEYVNDNEYKRQLAEAGAQELAQFVVAENFEGSIDLINSSFDYGADFELGDIVTVQDNSINKYINVRVVTATEVQDDNGYSINIGFGAV